MITAYFNETHLKPTLISVDNAESLKHAAWIDLLAPSREEELVVERMVGINIPTREEMQEIEVSSRLYAEGDALFMTVVMIMRSQSDDPVTDAVTLILQPDLLITVRYIEPQSFVLFSTQLTKLQKKPCSGTQLLVELIDASIDRLADILENISHQLDAYSKMIFNVKPNNPQTTTPDFQLHLRLIGKKGDLTTKVQESLVTYGRMLTFLQQSLGEKMNENLKKRVAMLSRDVTSLMDYVSFLSNKLYFLLDATLGMVSIEQNNIIKIFSIAAVIFLPPTLVASIYGMNFLHMPELSWRFGYPIAIGLMLLAAFLPYQFFKMKKWL